jgi:hypothetical protein
MQMTDFSATYLSWHFLVASIGGEERALDNAI